MAFTSARRAPRRALGRRRTVLALAALVPGMARAGRASVAHADDLPPTPPREISTRAGAVAAGQAPDLVAVDGRLYVTYLHEGEVYTRAVLLEDSEGVTGEPEWRLTNTGGTVAAHGVASYGAGAYVALRTRSGAESVQQFDAAWREVRQALLPRDRPSPPFGEPHDAPGHGVDPDAAGLLVAYSPECLYVATAQAATAPAPGAYFRHLDAGLRLTHTWSVVHAVDWFTASLSTDGAALSVLAAVRGGVPAGDQLVVLRFDARTGQETSLLERVPLSLPTLDMPGMPTTPSPQRHAPGSLTPTPEGYAVVYTADGEAGAGGSVYLSRLDPDWSVRSTVCLAPPAGIEAPMRPVHLRALRHGRSIYVAYEAARAVVLYELPDQLRD